MGPDVPLSAHKLQDSAGQCRLDIYHVTYIPDGGDTFPTTIVTLQGRIFYYFVGGGTV